MTDVTYAPGAGLLLTSGSRGLFLPEAADPAATGDLLAAVRAGIDEAKSAAGGFPAAFAWDVAPGGGLWSVRAGTWQPVDSDDDVVEVGAPDGPRFPIGDGAVPASGVWLRRAEVPSRHEMPDANNVGRAVGRGVVDEPERSDDDTFDLDSIIAQRNGAQSPQKPVAAPAQPRVPAVRCPCSAINRPGERACRRCGLDLHSARIPTVDVSWPVVATLRFDDGSAYELSRPLVVGRAPRRRPPSDPAVRLTVDSAASTVSGSHLELRPEGWAVKLTDLESSNGTYLEPPGAEERIRLVPNIAVPIEHGSVVWFGDRSLTVRLVHGS